MNVGEWCCHNIHTVLPKYCFNTGPQCWGVTLPQHSNNIGTVLLQLWPMLWQCWDFHWNTMLAQYSHTFTWASTHVARTFEFLHMNVVATLGTDVETALPQFWSVCWVSPFYSRNPYSVIRQYFKADWYRTSRGRLFHWRFADKDITNS